MATSFYWTAYNYILDEVQRVSELFVALKPGFLYFSYIETIVTMLCYPTLSRRLYFITLVLLLAGCSVKRSDLSPVCVAPIDASGFKFTSSTLHCYAPGDIRAAYGIDALASQGLLGQGQTIIIIDPFGSPTIENDLGVFQKTFFPELPVPDFEQIFPLGKPGSPTSAATGWSGEATLDVQAAYAIAPLAKIILAVTPINETEGMKGFPAIFKVIKDMFGDYPAGTVFSISISTAEQTFKPSDRRGLLEFDNILATGNSLGYTFFASSGDRGTTWHTADGKHDFQFPAIGWPASSPQVTAVGGTHLQLDWIWQANSDRPYEKNGNPDPRYWNTFKETGLRTETVWNESWRPMATGGGKSILYPRPAWQDTVADVIGENARGIPDIAWNAAVNGGLLIYVTSYPQQRRPGWHILGGTSAAAPQVAALTALINQFQAENHAPPLGHLNPLLYSIKDSAAFNAVSPVAARFQGSANSGRVAGNQNFVHHADGTVTPGPVSGFPSLPGWDLTTGFGSPNAPVFLDRITRAKAVTDDMKNEAPLP